MHLFIVMVFVLSSSLAHPATPQLGSGMTTASTVPLQVGEENDWYGCL